MSAVKRLQIALVVFAGVSGCLLMGVKSQVNGSESQPILVTRAPVAYPTADLEGKERFPQGAQLVLLQGSTTTSLFPTFYASADANVHPGSFLFAGRKSAAQPWQIYESQRDGAAPRQLTKGPEDCILPFYLPDGRFVYAKKLQSGFVLTVASLTESGKETQISHAAGNYLPAGVLQDGRILFLSGFPLGSQGQAEVYTVYPDGSGVEAYRCDHTHARFAPAEQSNHDILFASRSGLARFTDDSAQEVSFEAPAGDYSGGIAATDANNWIVSRRSPLLHASKAGVGASHYALDWMENGRLRPLLADASSDYVQPVLLRAYERPLRFPSALHPWKTANLMSLNSYRIEHGALLHGEIAQVQVSTRDAQGHVQVQGTAPVEKDGSFFVMVPGNQPLQYALLDRQGRVLRQEHGWFWSASGEQRICVGCHAGPERSPENRVPQILLRSTDPTDLSGTSTIPAGR
ncbi:hypothetical protein ACOBR2_13870 [Telmatobacter bradus]|uniref:HzsA-related protein n=1 Tax=Telmatobacter bradus TaxID=474953 RepID=UPI003B4360D2